MKQFPDPDKLEFPESLRVYHFKGGETVTLTNVIALRVSPSGFHRLETADGKKHIVAPGWQHVEFEADGWSL
jgi:hypothetical protein